MYIYMYVYINIYICIYMYIFLYSDPAAFKQPAGDTECRRPTGPPRMQNLPGRVHTNIYVYLYKYIYI